MDRHYYFWNVAVLVCFIAPWIHHVNGQTTTFAPMAQMKYCPFEEGIMSPCHYDKCNSGENNTLCQEYVIDFCDDTYGNLHYDMNLIKNITRDNPGCLSFSHNRHVYEVATSTYTETPSPDIVTTTTSSNAKYCPFKH